MTLPNAIPDRRYDLDWLRIAAFGLLIFYHVGMFYVTWGFHVKSSHAGPAANRTGPCQWFLRESSHQQFVMLRVAVPSTRMRSTS